MNELDADVLQTSLGNRILFAESLGKGLGAIESQKKSAAAEEVRSLAKEVAHIL